MLKLILSVSLSATTILSASSIRANCLSSEPHLYGFTGYYTGVTTHLLTIVSPSRSYECVLTGQGEELGNRPTYGRTLYYACSNGARLEMGSNSYNRSLTINIDNREILLEPEQLKETCRKSGFGTTTCTNRLQKLNCTAAGMKTTDTWQFATPRGERFIINRTIFNAIKSK